MYKIQSSEWMQIGDKCAYKHTAQLADEKNQHPITSETSSSRERVRSQKGEDLSNGLFEHGRNSRKVAWA